MPKHLFPEFEFYTTEGKDLLIVHVYPLPEPFYIKQEGNISGVYLRLGATTRQAPPEFIAEIKRRKTNQYFDEEPCLKAQIEDIDTGLIEKTFSEKRHKITEAKLITLQIFCERGGKVRPTNGGMILFGRNDKRLEYFPNTEISCARFEGTTKASFIDRLDLTDSSLLSIEEIPKFIRRNTTLAAEFGDIKRKDIPQYPIAAVREVLLNALMHANYELRGSRFYVAIYDDRLEIQNPGNLPPGMTLDDFKAGISKIRNPMIARIFRELENLEAWGSGYERICNVCEEGGYPLPEWEEVGPIIRVTFFPINGSAKPSVKKVIASENKLSPRLEEIIALLEKHGALSTKELMKKLSNPPSDRWLRDELNRLVNMGLLKSEGATSTRKWLLTE